MGLVYKKYQAGGKVLNTPDSVNTTSRFLPYPEYSDKGEWMRNPNYIDPNKEASIDPGFRMELPPGSRNIDPGFNMPISDTVNRDPGFNIGLPKNDGMKKYMDRLQRTKPDTTGQLKYQEGGNPIDKISPNAKNAIMDARDNSFANPESSEERYYKNFKPASGEAKFDPLGQLMLAEGAGMVGRGIKAGYKTIANSMANNAAKKATDQNLKLALAKARAHNAEQIRLGNMTGEQAWKTVSSIMSHYSPLYKKGGLIYKKFQQGGNGIQSPYAPINKNTYTAPGVASELNFGHIDQTNPGVYYRQGDNYTNMYGANASLPGMVNKSSGSLRRGEYDDWMAANTAETGFYEFDDQDNVTNAEAARQSAFGDFRKKYGDMSVMDDAQFRQTHAQKANTLFEDPTLNQIDYGYSQYTKPEGYASTPGQADEFDTSAGGLGKYGVNAYQYNRALANPTPAIETPVETPIATSPGGIKPAPKVQTTNTVPRTYSGPKASPGSFKKPKKGTSTRHLDKMRRKRNKGGLIY